MSCIRSHGNKATEVALAKLFRRHKITGWHRQVEVRIMKAVGGIFRVRLDFIFPKFRIAVFVDGYFWHDCLRHGTQPKWNRAFWKNKFAKNKARDRRVNRALWRVGWRAVRIWECALKKRPLTCVQQVRCLQK